MSIKVEHIAKMCHQANKAFCEALGDLSQQQWETAPGWQKALVTQGVLSFLKAPDVTAAESHENWVVLMEKQGWTFDTVKDDKRLVHPNILPFHDLPIEQQMKDELFIAICKTMMVLLGKPEVVIKAALTPHPDDVALAMDKDSKPGATETKKVEQPSDKKLNPAPANTLPSGAPMPEVKEEPDFEDQGDGFTGEDS